MASCKYKLVDASQLKYPQVRVRIFCKVGCTASKLTDRLNGATICTQRSIIVNNSWKLNRKKRYQQSHGSGSLRLTLGSVYMPHQCLVCMWMYAGQRGWFT